MFSLENTEAIPGQRSVWWPCNWFYEKVKHLSSLLFRGAVLSKTGHSSPQATSLQSEVTEVEKDLTLRCLLWESLQEWQGLVDQWEATPFETLNIDEVQQNVTRFIQTVFLLEKGTLVFLPFGGYGFSSTVSILGKFDLTEKRKHGFVWSVKSSIQQIPKYWLWSHKEVKCHWFSCSNFRLSHSSCFLLIICNFTWII